MPKDEGLGVMISAFASREFGFGLNLSQEQLQRINQARRGTKYSDEAAAKETRGGNANKQPLTKSPFVVEFEYGANNQGYWRYDHMILQFEDCIDVLKTLWPEFDYVFLFDHSCGHDRQRPDGLTITGLNKGFGGAQPKMRDTRIGEDDTDIGIHKTELTLKGGDVQSMQFLPSDAGPCWMSGAQREATRKDRPSGKTVKSARRVAELKKDLQAKGVLGTGDRKELRQLCALNDVPIFIESPGISEGWEGKAKGTLQILFERDSSTHQRLLTENYPRSRNIVPTGKMMILGIFFPRQV